MVIIHLQVDCLKKDAVVRGLDEFPLKTTFLLSTDALMTEYSLGSDWSILHGGKLQLMIREFVIFLTGVKAFGLAFLLSLSVYLHNTL